MTQAEKQVYKSTAHSSGPRGRRSFAEKILQIHDRGLSAGVSSRTAFHVAATHMDPEEPGVIFLGLSGLPEIDTWGYALDDDAHICWCDSGAHLFVRGMPYEITGVSQDGVAMCMNRDCSFDPDEQVGMWVKEVLGKTFTLQVAELPNAPITVSIDTLTVDQEGIAAADVSFEKGSFGMLVPAWLDFEDGLHEGLQVYVGDLSIGCLSLVGTSSSSIKVLREKQKKVTRLVNTITLTQADGQSKSFQYEEDSVGDDTEALGQQLWEILRGGDADIATCGGDLAPEHDLD